MELKPKIGIGNLVFGMAESEVIKSLGKPDQTYFDTDDENQKLCEWNEAKLRLTFYSNENGKFGYLRIKSESIIFNGKLILGEKINMVIEEIFNQIPEWETENYQSWKTHFNEEYWITIHEEFGYVTQIELGVPFKNENEYNWPEKVNI